MSLILAILWDSIRITKAGKARIQRKNPRWLRRQQTVGKEDVEWILEAIFLESGEACTQRGIFIQPLSELLRVVSNILG